MNFKHLNLANHYLIRINASNAKLPRLADGYNWATREAVSPRNKWAGT